MATSVCFIIRPRAWERHYYFSLAGEEMVNGSVCPFRGGDDMSRSSLERVSELPVHSLVPHSASNVPWVAKRAQQAWLPCSEGGGNTQEGTPGRPEGAGHRERRSPAEDGLTSPHWSPRSHTVEPLEVPHLTSLGLRISSAGQEPMLSKAKVNRWSAFRADAVPWEPRPRRFLHVAPDNGSPLVNY